MSKRVVRSACAVLCLAVATMCPADTAAKYTPTIPPGYSGEVVLHVDYGKTPDKIRIHMPEMANGYWGPASVASMRVLGDRFYFIDDVVHTIKQYRSPGTFVWETESFENLHYCAVAPDGKVYAVWRALLDRLSCIDGTGKVLWTVRYRDILSREMLQELGLHESYGRFGCVNWTVHGLAVTLHGLDEQDHPISVAVLLGENGKLVRGVRGSVVGSDGTVYACDIGKGRERFPPARIVARELGGKVLREFPLDFGRGKGVRPPGDPGFSGMRQDPVGAFAVRGTGRMAAPIPITSFMSSPIEEILWRFGRNGRLKEEWRFPGSRFASTHSEIVPGPDGCVYHLQFAEKGIDVVKYARGKKGKAPGPPDSPPGARP